MAKYTILHRSRYDNHIALHKGKIYLFDNSGPNPDLTDDGPLVVAEELIDKIICYPSNFGPSTPIPVRHEGDHHRADTYTASTDLEGAIKLGRRLGVKVDMVTNIYDPKPKQ